MGVVSVGRRDRGGGCSQCVEGVWVGVAGTLVRVGLEIRQQRAQGKESARCGVLTARPQPLPLPLSGSGQMRGGGRSSTISISRAPVDMGEDIAVVAKNEMVMRSTRTNKEAGRSQAYP